MGRQRAGRGAGAAATVLVGVNLSVATKGILARGRREHPTLAYTQSSRRCSNRRVFPMIGAPRFQNGSLTLYKNKTAPSTWYFRFI